MKLPSISKVYFLFILSMASNQNYQCNLGCNNNVFVGAAPNICVCYIHVISMLYRYPRKHTRSIAEHQGCDVTILFFCAMNISEHM